jgi:YidC/Oxa1 family membrane protein insertase
MNDMSDQTRTIVFILVAVGILFAWSHFFMPTPPPQKPGQAVSQTAPAQVPGPGPASRTSTAAGVAAATAPARPVRIPTVEATSEKIIVVESRLYHIELSNRGGVVRDWQLKKYLDEQKPPQPLDLVNPDAAQHLGWPLSLLLSDAQQEAQANSALYEVTPASEKLDAPAEITFHWSDGHLDITKKLKFAQDYEMSIETSVTLDGKPLPVGVAWRGEFGDRSVYKASERVTVFYKQGGKMTQLQYKKLGVSGNQSQPLLQTGPMEFLGIEDQFFTATFLPEGTDLSLWDWTRYYKRPEATEPAAEMAAGTPTDAPLRMRVYVGPKELALLSKVRPSLEELVNFGWTGVIAKPLLFALQWLHKYIPNYGWAIVIFTLVLTMVLFPIRIWTFRSARKMQLVAPEIKSIQDRYRKYSMKDPRKRKMNEEVMAVYQREGINPLGSCLPMLVQIPFLWAFYRMLEGAIELRHAPWIGWVHDLSAKDPYYILPIAMAITTYLMTKMTPTPATVDPKQQKMMALMPVMMAVLFINLSSGLNLYYFTSNLIGVGQQWYLNRAHPLPSRSKFKKKNE